MLISCPGEHHSCVFTGFTAPQHMTEYMNTQLHVRCPATRLTCHGDGVMYCSLLSEAHGVEMGVPASEEAWWEFTISLDKGAADADQPIDLLIGICAWADQFGGRMDWLRCGIDGVEAHPGHEEPLLWGVVAQESLVLPPDRPQLLVGSLHAPKQAMHTIASRPPQRVDFGHLREGPIHVRLVLDVAEGRLALQAGPHAEERMHNSGRMWDFVHLAEELKGRKDRRVVPCVFLGSTGVVVVLQRHWRDLGESRRQFGVNADPFWTSTQVGHLDDAHERSWDAAARRVKQLRGVMSQVKHAHHRHDDFEAYGPTLHSWVFRDNDSEVSL